MLQSDSVSFSGEAKAGLQDACVDQSCNVIGIVDMGVVRRSTLGGGRGREIRTLNLNRVLGRVVNETTKPFSLPHALLQFWKLLGAGLYIYITGWPKGWCPKRVGYAGCV